MRKRLSRIGALLMALVMVLSMSGNVFAAVTGRVDSEDSGTITVKGVDAETNVTVTAYPIALAVYNADGSFAYDYIALYDVMLNSTDDPVTVATDRTDFTADDADKLESIRNTTKVSFSNETTVSVWTYEDGNGDTVSYNVGYDVRASYTLSYDATVSGYTADGVPVGSYLIVVTGSDSVVYGNAVVSVGYSETYTPEDGTVNMVTDGTTWVKKAEPTIEKVIVDGTYGGAKGNSLSVGSTVTFGITVDPIPEYKGDYPVFNVVDTLSEGLTLNTSSIKLYRVYTDTNGKEQKEELDSALYTLDTTVDQKITVDFVVGGEYKLNALAVAGDTIYIEYTATLNEKAEHVDTDVEGNTNTVTLTYSVDSRTSGDEHTDEDETYTYTFDIDGQTYGSITEKILTKYGVTESGSTTTLNGATFTLYTDSACTTVYTNDSFSGSTTTANGGKFKITGLAEGTYYLKETGAPSGYSLSNAVYEITISATYNNDGTLDTWTIAVKEVGGSTVTSTFSVTYNGGTTSVSGTGEETGIQNTKTSELPSTGGYGTMIFTLIGCAVMIISAAAYIRCREKKVG